MKITFISMVDEFSGMSSRVLSSYVRSLGHKSRIIFLPTPTLLKSYSNVTLQEVVNILNDSDIVGITVITNLFFLAAQLSEAIHKNTRAKIIWGGIHATVRPLECLKFADWVCVGEGEPVLKDIMDGKPISQILGLWYIEKGKIVENSFSPLIEDISTLPFQDFTFEDHFYINPIMGQSGELTRELYREKCRRVYEDARGVYRCFYKTMTSRGCPFACTYCNNSIYHSMYTARHYRKRSISDVIKELENVCRENDFIELIHFADDSFFSRSSEEIIEFSRMYKERVSLPFKAITVPSAVTEEKLEALVEVGLCNLCMGIESGSLTALMRYNRKADTKTIYRAISMINRYRDRMSPPRYDIICHDPLGTIGEQRESIGFLLKIPRPYRFIYYNLMLFPGTKLNKIAKEKGLAIDEIKQAYRSSYHFEPHNSYDIILLLLNLSFFPRWIARFFLPKFYYKVSIAFPVLTMIVFRIITLLDNLQFAINRIIVGDWECFRNYFIKMMRRK
ncbi:MAG: radical SAM protein [Candidatus Omnitrophica bacterium]|nr:radical SAM protein [Candidatus Omnitrophota bacterium]